MKTFGGFVQGLREHAGLSREEFGARVHLSKHSVASIELGRRLADERFVELAEGRWGYGGVAQGVSVHGAAAGVRGVVQGVGAA